MKKLLIFIAVAALFLGCNSESKEGTTETSAMEGTSAPASTDTSSSISTKDTLKIRRPDQ